MSYFNATLILLGAGSSTRFGLKTKKQWLRINDLPLWAFVADKIASYGFKNIIVTGTPDEIKYMRKFATHKIVAGGNTRQESLKNALEHVDTEWVFSQDIARVCTPLELFDRIFSAKDGFDCVIPAIKAQDTTLLDGENLQRDLLSLVQTPQLSRTVMLKKALNTNSEYTDDSTAIKAIGGKVKIVDGDKKAHKLTTIDDLSKISCLTPSSKDQFVGFGTDTHAFEDAKPMMLGGVEISNAFGFKAHSDGDVLIHAIIDAILGAAGAGDIGEWFPDTDSAYKNADSSILLKTVIEKVYGYGFEIVNIDSTVSLEKPKLKEYKAKMTTKLAEILQISEYKINIKATTGEKLGFIGKGEGAKAEAIATLKFYDWKSACEY